MNKIIVILVALIVVAGGGYFLFFQGEKVSPQEQAALENEQAALEAEEIKTISSSNTVNAIDTELESTELGDLDKEFADVESEIEDALSGL